MTNEFKDVSLISKIAIEIDMSGMSKSLAHNLFLIAINKLTTALLQEKSTQKSKSVNTNHKQFIRDRLEAYMKRALQIEQFILTRKNCTECVDTINIRCGDTNFGYEKIFGDYLTDDVTTIYVQEPYLERVHQVSITFLIIICNIFYIFFY